MWIWGKLGLRRYAKKGIVFVTIYNKLNKFDTGLTKLTCKVVDLLAFLITQVLQVPIPASYLLLHHLHHQYHHQ